MRPRPHDDELVAADFAVHRRGVNLRDQIERRLGEDVIPAADVQNGDGDVGVTIIDSALLPIVVVVRMGADQLEVLRIQLGLPEPVFDQALEDFLDESRADYSSLKIFSGGNGLGYVVRRGTGQLTLIKRLLSRVCEVSN